MTAGDVNPNHVGYKKRLEFVYSLFKDELQLNVGANNMPIFVNIPSKLIMKEKPRKVQTIAYEAQFPFPYNNFIYVIDVDTKIINQNHHGTQPGTDHIPDDVNKFVLRLPNSESGSNNAVRVENEVAALSLAREALRDHLPNVVPRVFAWGSAAKGQQGWMLQEFMPGKSVFDEVSNLNEDELQQVLDQMADVLNCLQQYKIPASIRGYGGLTFDEAGHIIIGQMSTMRRGPFETYDDLILATINDKLLEADDNPRINGWREGGIRERLDKFLETGVRSTLLPVLARDPRLVHADLTFDNLLYDPATKRLSAVLDFDFSHIGTVADEFFWSLGRDIGHFPDAREGDEMLALNKAIFKGFPDPLPSNTDDINWLAAKLWHNALGKRQMHKPDNIPGIDGLSSLFWLSSQILPWKLSSDVVAQNNGPDKIRKWKQEGEESLDRFLKDNGF